jgi:hypothetical protein
MNESGGQVKCEESKQPKDDQDKSDYREHIFISLLLGSKDDGPQWEHLRILINCG